MRIHAVIVCALLLSASAAFADEGRYALVIGNDKYESLPKLDNAARDAKAVAERLESLGFKVRLTTNAGRYELSRAVRDFANQVSTGGTAVLYYAGHGVQSDAGNFLIGVDAQLQDEDDLEINALNVKQVIASLTSSGAALNVVILDACRDNPLPRRKRSASRGLKVEIVGPAAGGLLVAYAAAPDQTADDGPPGKQGVFARELVKALGEPGLKVEDVFKRVTDGVMRQTGNKQRPFINASLQGDFYFNPPKPRAASPSKNPAPTPPLAPAPAMDRETVFWESIKDSKDSADFNAYLAQFPKGSYASLAKNRLALLRRTTESSAPAELRPRTGTPKKEVAALKVPNPGGKGPRELNEATKEQRRELMNQGAELAQKENYYEAAKKYEAAFTLQPDGEAAFQLGEVSHGNGDDQAAEKWFTRAIPLLEKEAQAGADEGKKKWVEFRIKEARVSLTYLKPQRGRIVYASSIDQAHVIKEITDRMLNARDSTAKHFGYVYTPLIVDGDWNLRWYGFITNYVRNGCLANFEVARTSDASTMSFVFEFDGSNLTIHRFWSFGVWRMEGRSDPVPASKTSDGGLSVTLRDGKVEHYKFGDLNSMTEHGMPKEGIKVDDGEGHKSYFQRCARP